jgi:hypothetical protein
MSISLGHACHMVVARHDCGTSRSGTERIRSVNITSQSLLVGLLCATYLTEAVRGWLAIYGAMLTSATLPAEGRTEQDGRRQSVFTKHKSTKKILYMAS